MQKIPTVFKRDPDERRYVIPEVTPGCEWVLAGEGKATRKRDGTCVMLDAEGRWWNRREIRAGKSIPADAVDLGVDENTGKHMVWVPNSKAGFKQFLELAIDDFECSYGTSPMPGTYELCGPKIDTRGGQNPEGLEHYVLFKHGVEEYDLVGDGGFDGLKSAILLLASNHGVEGVVWHHHDGRMAKLKARDFR